MAGAVEAIRAGLEAVEAELRPRVMLTRPMQVATENKPLFIRYPSWVYCS